MEETLQKLISNAKEIACNEERTRIGSGLIEYIKKGNLKYQDILFFKELLKFNDKN